MTLRLLQPHFFLRALRAQARYACRRATRASALRTHGTHLCELSDKHSSSEGVRRLDRQWVPLHDLEQAEGWEAAVLKLEERLMMARTAMDD